MRCPQCGDFALSTQRVLGIVRHRCRACDGVWFDREALNAVGETLPATLDEPLGSLADSLGPRQCPRCADAMVVEILDDDDETRLDICHRHGVWLARNRVESVFRDLMTRWQARRPAWRGRAQWWRSARLTMWQVLFAAGD